MDSIVTGGSSGICIAAPGFSFFHRSEKVLMNWMTASRSWAEISYQGGIAVPHSPWLTVMNKSSSEGSEFAPPTVERNLNVPEVKSRGLGFRKRADGPLPSPFSP